MSDHAHRLYCTNLHHGLREGDCLECDLMNERARAEAAEARVTSLEAEIARLKEGSA